MAVRVLEVHAAAPATPVDLPVSLAGRIRQKSSPRARTAEPGDLFGASLAVADFDDDGCDEDWGATDAMGMVTVIFGDPSGLGSGPVADITPGTFGLSGTDGAHLGHALATGDFHGDGDADLAISSPGADAGSVASSGAVWILRRGMLHLRQPDHPRVERRPQGVADWSRCRGHRPGRA